MASNHTREADCTQFHAQKTTAPLDSTNAEEQGCCTAPAVRARPSLSLRASRVAPAIRLTTGGSHRFKLMSDNRRPRDPRAVHATPARGQDCAAIVGRSCAGRLAHRECPIRSPRPTRLGRQRRRPGAAGAGRSGRQFGSSCGSAISSFGTPSSDSSERTLLPAPASGSWYSC